jgi:hypothetical protein
MKLGTHVADGERRKPIDNEVCRTKVKVTTSQNRTKIRYFCLYYNAVLKLMTEYDLFLSGPYAITRGSEEPVSLT